MKANFRKLLNKNTILYVLSFILIVIIGYNIFVYLNVYEGNESLPEDRYVITIRPIKDESITDSDVTTHNLRYILNNDSWLNIREIMLYDEKGELIPYTATASSEHNSSVSASKLYDQNDGTIYHSGTIKATITIKAATKVDARIAKITIKNRIDCEWRLKAYEIVVEDKKSATTRPPYPLKNLVNLYNSNRIDTLDIPAPIPNIVIATGGQLIKG